MGADDDGGVEFLGGSGADGKDEELPQPHRRDRSPRRRAIDVLLAAVVLGGLFVAAVRLSSGDGHPAATATPSVAPTTQQLAAPTLPPPVPIVTVTGYFSITDAAGRRTLRPLLPPRTAQDPTACPQSTSCFSTDFVSAPQRAAVRAVFPSARIVGGTVVRLLTNPWAGELWFRQIDARIAGAELLVRVEARSRLDGPGSGITGEGVVYYSATAEQYVVYIQVGPGGGGSVAALRRLAADPRLLATQ